MPPPTTSAIRHLHLPFCAFAIFASLVLYGALQERVMTKPYYPLGSHVADRRRHGPSGGTGFLHSLMKRRRLRPEPHGNGAVVRGGDGERDGMGAGKEDINKVRVPRAGESERPEEALRAAGEEKEEGERLGFGEDEDDDATEDGALFQNSLFLVLANRVVAVVVTLLLIAFRRDYRRDLLPVAPLWCYVAISVSNGVATSCQYEALKWLTFPTLTVGKCAKMLPVMLLQNLRTGKRYTRSDFAVAASVAAGAAIMIVAGSVSPDSIVPGDDTFGFVLLAAYLLFDAITSTYQEHLFGRHKMTVFNQMLFINISTGIIATLYLTASGQLFDSLAFLHLYPHAVKDVAALSVAAVAGQFAISHTIHAFGALVYAAIMTARQFCSVLVSDLLFEHGLNPLQWFGAFVVFTALFARAGVRSRVSHAREKTSADTGSARASYMKVESIRLDERRSEG